MAAHVELLEDHAVVRRPLALMQRGDDASHQSPGAAHVLLIGVVDVLLGLLYSLGRAPRARRRRRHGVVVDPIHVLDALQSFIVRRPARQALREAGGRGCGRDADRRAHPLG